MDRFVWTSGLLEINETLVIQQRGVRIYDGEEKEFALGKHSEIHKNIMNAAVHHSRFIQMTGYYVL